MFERFDEDARQSLFHARVAVSDRQGTSLDMEDVLVGVLIAKPSVVVAFAARGFDVASLTKGDT